MKTRRQTMNQDPQSGRTRMVQDARTSAEERLRNLGVAAHVDAGKTTLTERVLFHTGAIHKCGDVDSGNTATDTGKIERQKGITIEAAAVNCRWTQNAVHRDLGFGGVEHQFNIIDTPGHVDFTVEVERSLRVLDGLVVVLCAVGRVQPQTITVWRQADRYRTPRIVFVNKMDRLGADFDATLAEMSEKLSVVPLPLVIPNGAEDELAGQFDVINECELRFTSEYGERVEVHPLPESERERIRGQRAQLIETVAGLDDELSERFLAEETVTNHELIHAIRRLTLAGVAVPVIGGSAFRYVGVQPLIDAAVDYLPNPMEAAPIEGLVPDTDEKVIVQRSDETPRALVFKVVCDDHAGQLAFIRVYSGRIQKGDTLLNPRTRKRVRIGRLLRLQGSKREAVESAGAGEIVAAIGLSQVFTGDTLCPAEKAILFEPPAFPEPVVSIAIEPARSEDRKSLGVALQRMTAEDPTLRVTSDPETGQTLIAGMGELHLNVRLQTLKERDGVETAIGEPRIAYRETIRGAGRADHLHKKMDGGPGMYARVVLEVTPAERDTGIVIENRIVGGAIPSEFISACHRGIEIAAQKGVLAGHPVVDVKVTLLDGDHHRQESNDLAFQIAADNAMREALLSADPVLLEPIMHVACDVPAEHQGAVLGDLSRRRGEIRGIDPIVADVPLAEMFCYATDLRTLTKGHGTYSMEPCRFAVAPAEEAKAILKA